MNSLIPSVKPLLSATLEDPSTLPYPVLLSPKYDGFRALKYGSFMVSRNLKVIKNNFIQKVLKNLPEGLDGELIVGPPNEGLVFNRTSSGVTAIAGEPDFHYYVFDSFKLHGSYHDRHAELCAMPWYDYERVKFVEQTWAYNLVDFYKLEEQFLNDGYEGVMVRTITGHYKFGRATHLEQIIWKYKRFTDGEALITGVLEGVTNNNPAVRNGLGEIERSTKKENMAPSGLVGTILGKDLKTDEHLHISPGKMDHAWRAYFLKHPDEIRGKIAKFKVFEYGKVDKARFCTFQGFRDKDDL